MNHIINKWVLMRYHQTKLGCKRIISSEAIVELESKKQSYFDSINIHWDLDLEDGNRTFHSTLHLMMMHHNTKFGYKQMSGSKEDSCESECYVMSTTQTTDSTPRGSYLVKR